MLMPLVENHRGNLSVRQACAALGLCPSTYHRWRRAPRPAKVRTSPRALSAQEREGVLAELHAPRFVHISKLALAGGGHVNLYTIEDVYSRYLVGWMVAPSESSTLACQLVETSAQRQRIRPGHLTLHADRGSVMTSELLTQLLRRLGITQTHSRPRISDDNPFSESLFKTLKYHPGYPARFEDCAAAQAYCAAFFAWYNAHHKHSGLTYLSPAQVHLGQAAQHRAARNTVLAAAFDRHPERFVHGLPTAPALPDAVWINPPSPEPQPLGQDPKEPLQ